MRDRLVFLFVLGVLLSSAAFSLACPDATRTVQVPAVVGENEGGLLVINVRVQPGSGHVYSEISPPVGLMAQESVSSAVQHALTESGFPRKLCDVYFRVEGAEGSELIDGPSAGAAIAVAANAALQNKTVRQDAAITGTIEPGGGVGPVGGLIEKIRATSGNGVKIFVVPPHSVHEQMVLAAIASKNGVSVYSVDNLAEAEAVMFAPEGTPVPPSNLTLEASDVPENLTALASDPDLQRFGSVAARMVEEVADNVQDLEGKSPPGSDYDQFREYFKSEIANQRALLAKGYYFTAANNAFLLGIDVSFLQLGRFDNLNASQLADATATCMLDYRSQTKTSGNWQWQVGSDLRHSWSDLKLDDTRSQIAPEMSEEDKFYYLRELLYAQGWCQTAKYLDQPPSGAVANEPDWQPLAAERLAAAARVLETDKSADEDAQFHYRAAVRSNSTGNYGAAIYDSLFVTAMNAAEQEYAEASPSDRERRLANLSARSYQSLWGKIYASQAMFLLQSEKEGDALTAFKLFRFAQALDDASAQMALAANEEWPPAGTNAWNASAVQPPVKANGANATDAAAARADDSARWYVFLIAGLVSVIIICLLVILVGVSEGGW